MQRQPRPYRPRSDLVSSHLNGEGQVDNMKKQKTLTKEMGASQLREIKMCHFFFSWQRKEET